MAPERIHYERAKAERAHYIVSLAGGDQDLMREVRRGLEASDRGVSLLWLEFLRWEQSRHHDEV
jgi:hypothetical protein